MKSCCCTMYSPSYKELANISVPNLESYCHAHGYDIIEIVLPDNQWEYKKHEAFSQLFKEGYDLIWYKDVDSIITNMNIPITDFIDGTHSFFITMDFNELNGGSVIIKNTKAGIDFNEWILNNRNKYDNEQNCFNDRLTIDSFANTIRILNHPSINSYDYSLYPECSDLVGEEQAGDWKDGNFIIHFPGLGLSHRVELMKEYLKKVVQ